MARRNLLLPALIAAALLLACSAALLAASPEAEAAFPGENGRIVFSSDRDGDFDIYTIRRDGSDLMRVTNFPGSDSRPEWSPDGTKIAFDSDRDGDHEIYVKDLVTGEVSKLTDNAGSFQADHSPAWSPDGARIAFSSNRDTLEYPDEPTYTERVYVMKADGSELTRLTRGYAYFWTDISWSPDGTQLLFEWGHESDYGLGVMNADGSDQKFLLPPIDDPDERYPDWSPSGERIVFTKGVDLDGTMDVWTMDPDGSDQKQLTNSPAGESAPDWSPGGSKIVFERNGNLIKMRASDGSNKTNLTKTPDYLELDPDWKARTSTSGF